MNLGPDLPNMNAIVLNIQNHIIGDPIKFIALNIIQKLIASQLKIKVPGEDQITNMAMIYLPKT